jgi:hypothetical protein
MPHKTGHHGTFRQKPQSPIPKPLALQKPKRKKRKRRKKTELPFNTEKQTKQAA